MQSGSLDSYHTHLNLPFDRAHLHYDRARLNNTTVRTEFIIDPFVDDELYTYMKPVTTHFVSDDSKIDYSPQEAKEPSDYEVPKATNDNPYSYDN